MTPEVLARLHQACFVRPRPWSATEFAALLADPHNFLLTRPDAFLIGRTIADEAELLTLAVAPAARRRGIAMDLMSQFATTARSRNARRAFLEVGTGNGPALALYRGSGWMEAGLRRGYFGPGHDAVVMALELGTRQQGG